MPLAEGDAGRKPSEKTSRESLFSLAEKAAAAILSKHSGIIAVYLTGSVARGEATESSDVDVDAVLGSGFHENSRQPPLTIGGRTVFYRLHEKQVFEDVEGLLAQSLVLSAQLVEAVVLYDPTGFLSKVKGKVSRLYHEPRFVKQRIRLSLRFAEDYVGMGWVEFKRGNLDMVPPSICAAVLYGFGPALFFIADVAPTDRRCLSRLRQVCERLDQPGLYQVITELVNVDGASRSWALKALESAEALHRLTQTLLEHDAVAYEENRDWLSDAMRQYMVSGAMELLGEGDIEASLFCSMELGTRCLNLLNGMRLRMSGSQRLVVKKLEKQLFNPRAFDRDKIHESLTRARELTAQVWRLSRRLSR